MTRTFTAAMERANTDGEFFLDGEHVPSITALEKAFTQLKSKPLREINFREVALGQQGGALIAKALDDHPEMTFLMLDGSQLGDEGIAELAPAIARHPNLESFYARGCSLTEKGMESFFRSGAADKPDLIQLCLPQVSLTAKGDIPEAAEARFITEMDKRSSKNLSFVYPENDRIKGMTDNNSAAARLIINELGGANPKPVEWWSSAGLGGMLERAPVTFKAWQNWRVDRPVEEREELKKQILELKKDYEQLVQNLPSFPKGNDRDAFFVPNETRFAPVDNPRLWEGKTIEDFKAIPLTADLLGKRSEKYRSLVDSAVTGLPTEEVIGYLNQQGVTLRSDKLLNAEGKPSALLEQLIDDGKAPALFTADNWRGASRSEVLKVAEHLPDDQRQKAGVNALIQQISTRQSGLGR